MNPFTQQAIRKDVSANKPTTSGTLCLARKRPSHEIDDGSTATPQPPRKQAPQQPATPESDEAYAHRVLTQIFRITVDPHHMTAPTGQRLIFLPGLNEELNESGEPLRIGTGIIDQAIIEACSIYQPDKPLMTYLLPCWKRANKTAQTKTTVTARAAIHEEAKRLCMSNCLFALTMPDLFGLVDIGQSGMMTRALTLNRRESNPEHDTLAPYLLKGVADENGLDFDFIQEAIKRFEDDEAFPAVFNDAMVRLSSQLNQLSMGDDYKPYVQVCLRGDLKLRIYF